MKTLIRLATVAAAVVIQSLSSWASDVHGITNIHVNAFVPYTESFAGTSVGNASMWLNMSEDGLAKKIYDDFHQYSKEVGVDYIVANSVPDALFPTNTVMAHVWRSPGSVFTNAYNALSANVAKTIIDPEVVNLLTNFAPIVKSVTRGVGSATIPYVDADGNQRLGKAVILGCKKNDWTAYNILVKELKRIGDGYEETPYSGTRRYVVTNSTVRILGSRTPSVAYGTLGYVIISTSDEVWNAIAQAAWDFSSGKKPFYDARRQAVAASDAELLKIDPTYPRNFKTDGFERFGYAVVTSKYLPALAKALDDFGINPAIAGTNTTFHYLTTICSEACTSENSRMRIDLQGSRAALRSIGGTLRFANLLLVNAGRLDRDFMTFDEDWKYDPETLAQISYLAQVGREHLGLGGVNYHFTELEDRTKATASIGYTEGKGFQQLFCAGKSGQLEENPCEACLPSNTVAAFSFQPNAATWTELNKRLFTLLGQKSEILDQLFAMFTSHSKSFGKSASVGVVLGSSNRTIGSLKVSNGLDLVSAIKIEDENLWYSIRILLEQFGCKTRVGVDYPSVTICELTNSTLRIAYDRDYKIIKLSTSKAVSQAASAALRNKEARLISSSNKLFNKLMGIDVEAGEIVPDHNTLFYFAPKCDTVLHETLKEYLESVGLGALAFLADHDKLSDSWACGYGKSDAEKGIFETTSYVSKGIWDKHHDLFEAMAKTVGQIAADAYPYDASKARVFTSGAKTIHVSRADNWDDVNGRLYPYDGDNIRVRALAVAADGTVYDQTTSGRLESDGSFVLNSDGMVFRGYFSSEGVFYEIQAGSVVGYTIGRLAPEIEPELSILPSAEEIAEQVKQVIAAIGISNVTVGAAKSDDRTGPFGEKTVVRETTIVPIPDGGLDRLLPKERHEIQGKTTSFMPSNTVFGTSFWFADGALTNAIAAVKYAQPELVEYVEKLFGGFGFTEAQLAATVKDALALGLAKEEDGIEPFLVIRINRNQYQQWVDLTNRLYNTSGVTVTDFQTSQMPDVWEAIAFKRIDPISGREIKTCYTRILETDDRVPHFIITQNDKIQSGLTARVRRAGLYQEGSLVNDPTFQACWISGLEPGQTSLGISYLAPIAEKYWFYNWFLLSEDGELVIKRRTSAAVAPYEATVARFAVNFFEALRGDKSVITFENDAEADKVAEAATSNVVAQLRYMRTKLGVTGLDFYDADPDEDGRYGNSELAIGTRGDGCEFMKRFAANAPASEHLVETYIPAIASAMAKGNAEPGLLADDVDASMKAAAELVSEKYPQIAAAITNFLASDEWRISAESIRLTGTHKAMAVLQDLDNPFVKDLGDNDYASICAGYSVLSVFGPMDSSLPFLLIKQAVTETETKQWRAFTTNGIEYVIHNGWFKGRDLSQFIRPTFAFNATDNVMVFATSLKAARAAVLAGRDGTNRLIDSEKFFDVTGFKADEPMPEHNTLVYFAPQNDDILGCTLRRILSPYLPESYAMLLDRPSLKGYWGAAYGVRVGDAFRIYTHAGMKGHKAFLGLGQALLKTAAESLRFRQPYDWTESKVLRSADVIRLVEPTGEKGIYASYDINNAGTVDWSMLLDASSDNPYVALNMSSSMVLSKSCQFESVKDGNAVYNAGRDAFHLLIVDEETDPDDFNGGVTADISCYTFSLPAGDKVNREIRLYPSNAKITKATGLPKGLSLKKTKDGYFLTGTPTKVGECCVAVLTASCAGRQTTPLFVNFMISNYESEGVELDDSFEFTAGVDADEVELRQLKGWTASNLPKGMRFDNQLGILSGTPAKPGTYVVVFTARINGKTEKVSTVITVDQGDGISIDVGFNDKTSELAADGETREIYMGVKIDWPIALEGLEGVETKLTEKYLPTGLKLVKGKDGSYSIQGIALRASSVDKKTGEVKPSKVTLTGTNKYGWKSVKTFNLVVKALPKWAIGTFNGYHGDVQGDIYASVKVTVSSVGKVSVGINGVSPTTMKTTVDSFACTGFDSYDPQNQCFAFAIESLKFKSDITGRFSGAIELDKNLSARGREVGCFIASVDHGEALRVEQATNYSWSKWTFPTGRSQRTLELTDEVNPGLDGLILKFSKGGKVTIAGKVKDSATGKDVRISASAPLVYESNKDIPEDGYISASVSFVVKTKTPFYAYVPVWLERSGDTIVNVYEEYPTKGE